MGFLNCRGEGLDGKRRSRLTHGPRSRPALEDSGREIHPGQSAAGRQGPRRVERRDVRSQGRAKAPDESGDFCVHGESCRQAEQNGRIANREWRIGGISPTRYSPLAIRAMHRRMASNTDISALLDIMRRLRDPKSGCPWDIEQSFATIAPYTIEEAYEVAGAIEDADWPALKEGLGDLLLQVVFHSQMAGERNLVDFNDVVAAISGKMRRRHPHVFGGGKPIASASAQTLAWEEHKA